MSHDLDVQLLAAHASGDRAELVRLYRAAAEAAERDGRGDAAGFYMTHAYVFALEAGMAEATKLKAWLVEKGRESDQ